MNLTSYTIEREYPVSPERLFQAFTDPEDLKKWIWGPGSSGVRAQVDAKVNGTFEIVMDGKDGPVASMRGVYAVVDGPTRLVHTLHWDQQIYKERGIDEILMVDIEPRSDGCRLVYRHLGIPDDGVSVQEHERSVRITLDFLETHLTAVCN